MAKKERIELLTEKYAFANKILGAHGIKYEDREDLLHEIYILAFKSIDQLKDMDKIESWLWSITENRLKLYKKQFFRKSNTEVSLGQEDLELRISQHVLNLDQMANVINKIATCEELRFALHQLDRETLTILNLHYGLGYKLIEISKAQGKNYSTVKSMHSRGLAKLRRIIEQERVFKNGK